MFKIIRRILGRRDSAKPARRKQPSVRRLAFDALDSRELLAPIGPEIWGNTANLVADFETATASQRTEGGRTIIAWIQQYSATDFDIHARLFDSSGNALSFEIPVAISVQVETQPTVGMDNNGNSVVCWTQAVSSTNRDIKCQRITAAGTLSGSVLTVANSTKNEYDPSVAMAGDGRFVVSYTVDTSSTNRDVKGKRYTSTGTTGSSFTVAASSTRNEYHPSAARAADGRFAIAYQIDTLTGGVPQSDIMLKRYTASGSLVGTHTIANATNQETNPQVAMDSGGNSVVVYEYDFQYVLARPVSSTGVVAPLITVALSPSGQYAPSVAMDQTAGDGRFVVAYEGPGITGESVFIREMKTDGTVLMTQEFDQNGSRFGPSIAINGSDVYFAAYTFYSVDGSPSDILAQRGLLGL